jgi:hypothetical protein
MEEPSDIYTVEIIRNPLNERYVLRETWKDHAGQMHRFDGPAFVQRCADGTVDEKRWFNHGVQYLPGGRPRNRRGLLPSFQPRDLRGLREAKRLMKTAPRDTYTVEVFEHPVAAVALTETWKNAQGLLHRIGGPAFIQRNGTDIVLTKMWAENGRILRVEHPSPPKGEYDLSMPGDRYRLAALMRKVDSDLAALATRNEVPVRNGRSPTL